MTGLLPLQLTPSSVWLEEALHLNREKTLSRATECILVTCYLLGLVEVAFLMAEEKECDAG